MKEDFASGGIGRRLVDGRWRARGACASIEIINLTVTADNLPAVRLYSRQGFQALARESPRGETAGAYLDKLHMWRPVSADYIP